MQLIAEIKEIEGFLYVNTGDFVESCTAIVEHFNGRLELVRWRKQAETLFEAKKNLQANVHE
jgi:hypothetical protein